MPRPVYIYALSDPRDHTIRYIGKTVDTTNRLQQHIDDAFSGKDKGHKGAWILQLLKVQLRPQMAILETVTEQDWPEREKYWISFYREKQPNITNIAPGGPGEFQDPEAKSRAVRKKYDVIFSKLAKPAIAPTSPRKPARKTPAKPPRNTPRKKK